MNRAPWFWRLALLWAAGLNAAGWLLSLVGWLGPTAYGLLALVGAFASIRWGLHESRSARPARTGFRAGWIRACSSRWRWRQGLPRAFVGLGILALAGGLLYAPNNIDALAYRTPRVLHWLAEGRWHWIDCPYQRLNVRASGFEWLTVPILALTHSDRLLFLLNLGCFVALPGLTFTLLREAHVTRRAAWTWMWLFPTGYCFALQAGGIGNDLYGATVSAAACAFAWRARNHRQFGDLVWSILALALATGAKTSNVLLGLPWLVLVWPAIPALQRNLGWTAATFSLAALSSLAPQAWLNWRHCGDWTGARAEYAWTLPPRADKAVVHNLGLFASQNLLPPINPLVGRLNDWVEQQLPESWKMEMDAFAEGKRRAYAVRELPGEEHGGLGAGLAWTLLIGLVLGMLQARWRPWFTHPTHGTARVWHLLAGFGAIGVFCVKSAIQTNGRILAPFYIWILPGLVGISCPRWFTGRTGRWLQRLVLATVFAVVILCPSRPLWPAETVLSSLGGQPGSALERAATVYRIYQQRAEAFASLRERVPSTESILGFITGNEAETSLWKPYGHRRLVHVLPPYSRESLDRLGVRWLVVDLSRFQAEDSPRYDDWLARVGGRQVVRETLQLLASRPPQEYALVQLGSATAPP